MSILFIMVWIACSVLSYGCIFAYFQREYPNISENLYEKNRRLALLTALLGPLALATFTVTFGFKHGLKFK